MSSLVCLFNSLTKNFFAYTLNLNIHLDSGNAFCSTRYLKVHIAEEVFQSLYIGKNGNLAAVNVFDKSHRNARHGSLDGNARIHKRKRRTANRALRRRTVGRKNFGYESYRVREFVFGRNYGFKSPFRQSAVTDFASAGAS